MRILILLAALGVAGAARAGTVVFLSDFGTKDSAVAVCKGVMWSIEPELRIVDLTHEVPAFDVGAAARLLDQTVPFYPKGTVFVSVVDPGVGSPRRAISVRTKAGHFLVGPDNGAFTLVLENEGLDAAVELKEPRFFRPAALSSTFHGRDIFSPVGAHLAAGTPLEDLGPEVSSLVALRRAGARIKNGAVEGEVDYIEDPYGNVVTTIPRSLAEKAELAPGISVRLTIGDKTLTLPFKNTFSDVPEGSDVAVWHSRGALSFSINMGDFAKAHGVKARQTVTVRRAAP